jgi:hypothetical protein
MIDSLPNEIYLEFYKYLSFFDMISLQLVNQKLHIKLKNISHYIITEELYRLDNVIPKRVISYNMSKLLNDTYINLRKDVEKMYYIPEHIYKEMTNKNYYDLQTSVTRYIIENINFIEISKNDLLNGLYRKLLRYYLKNRTYNDFNKYLLYFFYMIYTIDKKNTYNINYNIKFLDSILINKDTYNIIITTAEKYFSYIIKNDIDINIESKYVISKYVVTIPILRKLMSMKKLDLTKTELLMCCKTCLHYNIREMAMIKYNMFNNPIVKYNYNIIKIYLKTHEPNLLDKLNVIEMKKVNDHISFRNPFNKKRMYLSSRYTKHFLYTLKYESTSKIKKSIYTQLDNYIISQQVRLYTKFFE